MTVLKYLDLEGLAKYDDLLKSYIDNTYLPLSGGTMTGVINSIDILPKSNLEYNLGSAAKSYKKLYTRYIDTPSNYDLRFMAGGTEYMRIAAAGGALTPNITNTIDIGTSSYKFRNIYGNLKGNADTATTASSLPEAKLTWGGKNFAASWGPIDAAMIPELGANRLEYYPGDKIKIEYSTDNGASWTDSALSEVTKSQIFSTGTSVYLGGSSVGNVDKSQYQTRITLTTKETLYSKLNKFAIKISTAGSQNCWCSIDVRLQQNIEDNVNTWDNIVERVSISGWPGWNIINTGGFTTYGNQKGSHYGEIRFTFGATHESTSSNSGLVVSRIKGFGGEGWATPSNKALTGTIYTEQYDQSTSWPNTLYPKSTKTIDLGTSSKYWNNIYAGHVYIGGTKTNTTSKITSDTTTNMYFDVGGVIALMVLNGSDKTIRPGTSNANTVNLGASAVPFKSLYVNDAYLSKALTLTGTTQDDAIIKFSRSTSNSTYGYNYITAPVGGIISITPGVSSPTSSTGYQFTSTELRPGATNTYSLGTSTLRFKNIYGDLKGTADNSISIKSSTSTDKLYAESGNIIKYYATIVGTEADANGKRYAGDNTGFPVSSNANSILWLGNHTGNSVGYGSQLGFSSNGNIYYRFIANGSIPTDSNGGSWKKLSYDGHNHNSLYKQIQTEVSDPVSSGSTISFIDTISQNTQGKITVTKKTVSWITDDEISSLWN